MRAKQATVDYFGWSEEFDSYADHAASVSPTGNGRLFRARPRKRSGGIPMVIGRGTDHHRPGPQNRFRFHVSSNASLLDIAELAHFTLGDWDWITRPNGTPWTREQWGCAYDAGR